MCILSFKDFTSQEFFYPSWNTVVGDNINIMKTTFELNFYFYQAFKQQGHPCTFLLKSLVEKYFLSINIFSDKQYC